MVTKLAKLAGVVGVTLVDDDEATGVTLTDDDAALVPTLLLAVTVQL